eukprot:CAMPEP_0170804898 /NCGR_PEP_ID=MMETSP0733-20121128/31023_1 /TAXON_ID=186038 /ORGANISM="Fragilariopsis kerguelensis, Strain L26-C5" /LENGTH=156 /DNA_ID=CAMNT_0011159125 /DNA_START=1 /DNA_END=472 /DNA_ORIENTATION=-
MHDYNNDNDITRRIKKSRIGGVEDDREEKYPSSPSQWWFSRHYFSTVTGSDTNILSGMILNENLGITSDVIESLTHDVSNWSLTRIQVSLPPPSITTTSTNTNITTHTNISNHSEKIKQNKDAKTRNIKFEELNVVLPKNNRNCFYFTVERKWTKG